MTNRMDHTDCSHDATPAGRKVCRADRRLDIMDAQARYVKIQGQPVGHDNFEEIREYEATIDLFSMRWGMDLHAAYDLIERGPVVF